MVQIVLFVLIFVLFVFLGGLAYLLLKIRKRQIILSRGIKGANLEEIVFREIKHLEELEKRLNELEAEQKKQGQVLLTSLKRVGLVRFNAFDDVGGKLSFAAALLDDEGNGIVFSTISGRQETRTYAKLIKNGKSSTALSREEHEAIQRAIKSREK